MSIQATDKDTYNHEIVQSEPEISLLDIVEFFENQWKKILFGGLVGGILGVSYALLAPPKFEASANIQVARVANVDVETPILLSEKLKLPSYYSQETLSACKLDDLDDPRSVLIEKLKPTLVKNTTYVSVAYKDKTVEIAKNCLTGVLNDIRNSQSELAHPIIEARKNQLVTLKSKLEDIDHTLKTVFSSKNLNFDIIDTKFSASALLFATVLAKENEVKDLRISIRDLELALAEPQTKPAYLVTPIYSSGLKVEPKRTLIVVGSVFAGALLMILYALIKKVLTIEFNRKKTLVKASS